MGIKKGLNYQSQVGEVGKGTWPLLRVIPSTSSPKEVNAIALAPISTHEFAISILGPDEKQLMDHWLMYTSEEGPCSVDVILGLSEEGSKKQDRVFDDFIDFVMKLK